MKTFLLIIFSFILIVSCNKKAPEVVKSDTSNTKENFYGDWNVTRNSSATGTSTYTARITLWLTLDKVFIQGFSGIPGAGSTPYMFVSTISGTHLSFNNEKMEHTPFYATGMGKIIGTNTISMTYTLTNGPNSEVCTDIFTK